MQSEIVLERVIKKKTKENRCPSEKGQCQFVSRDQILLQWNLNIKRGQRTGEICFL